MIWAPLASLGGDRERVDWGALGTLCGGDVAHGPLWLRQRGVREGLRLVEEREAKLRALRDTLRASIDAGGEATDQGIDAALDAQTALLRLKGVGE
jgi:hypothetical protein